MSLAAELKTLHDERPSKQVVVAAADLAKRALAVGDLPMAISAKQLETQTGRQLGMHQHTVVCCAEALELWQRIRDSGNELPDEVRSHLVWTLKHGAGSAMDLPEIPLATVRDLIAALHEVLEHFGARPYAAWELEARLAYIEGDKQVVADRVARLAPTISVRSHLWDHADCPGCSLMQFVAYLGLDAPIEEVEAAVAPLQDPAPFPLDREIARVVRMLYGDDKMCENANRWYPTRMARAYVRAGELARARAFAAKGLAVNADAEPERRMRAHLAALEVALAVDELDDARLHYDRMTAVMREDIEDPYDLLETSRVAHRAARAMRLDDDAARYRDQALALARRVDVRLERPRHVRETEAALAV